MRLFWQFSNLCACICFSNYSSHLQITKKVEVEEYVNVMHEALDAIDQMFVNDSKNRSIEGFEDSIKSMLAQSFTSYQVMFNLTDEYENTDAGFVRI